MCFKNLPVEFDETGAARLIGGIPDPYSVTVTRPEVAMTDAEREEQIKRLSGAADTALPEEDLDVLIVLAEAHGHELHRQQVAWRGRCDL